VKLFIGCVGWSIPSRHADRFDTVGSHLERYAAVFNAVEVNSSFYRPHQAKTYARWANSVPAAFRFAVKVPKSITHESRLVAFDDALCRFAGEVQGLGEKLGSLLVQLPPSLAFAATTAIPFFATLRQCVPVPIVCEPRHSSWFEPAVESELERCGISRVAADPAVVPSAANPGGSPDVAYFRLHGSPQMYHSAYGEDQLTEIAGRIKAVAIQNTSVWCIFDNTAAGAATVNALEMRERFGADGPGRSHFGGAAIV
jgi:uncharacterized protein YecE (DUF72 family)